MRKFIYVHTNWYQLIKDEIVQMKGCWGWFWFVILAAEELPGENDFA